MNILNLVDDEKFIDGLISEYDYFNQNSEFIILTTINSSNYKYIKKQNRVKKILVDSPEYQQLLLGETFDVVWVHYRNNLKMRFVNQIKKSCPDKVIIWSSWGADLYILLGLPLFGWKTLWMFIKNNKYRTILGFFIRRFLRIFKLEKLLWAKETKLFLKNLDLGTTILKEEWNMFSHVVKKNVTFLPFIYGSLPFKIKQWTHRVDLSSKRIWLGNSATYENNHFDVFPILKGIYNYEVVAPLSYGNIRDVIEKEGLCCFGQRWNSLKEFMPLDEYINQMKTCAAFIFPHRRQQAFGNVLSALRLGGCVFLDKINPIYIYLKQNKITVYTLNDLRYNFQKCLNEFREEQEGNVQRVMRLRSESTVIEELKLTFEQVHRIVNHKKSNVN